MSSTGVTLGYGTGIRIGRGDPVVWTELDGVGDVDFPNGEADEVEVTHMKSPARTKEYIQGLIDNGLVAVPVHWVPGSDTDVLLTAIRDSGEAVQIEFTAPGAGASAEPFAGFCKTYKRTAPINDKMMAEAAFRINGLVA